MDHDATIAPIIPAAPARVVVTKTKDIPPGSADKAEPHHIKTIPAKPKQKRLLTKGRLWPLIGLIEPSLAYFPAGPK